MQLIRLYPGLTSCTCGHGLFSLLTFSRSASRIPSTCLFLIIFFLMGDISPPCCCPLFHFLSHSATKCISIRQPYFFCFHHARLQHCYFNYVRERQGYARVFLAVNGSLHPLFLFLQSCSFSAPLACAYVFLSSPPQCCQTLPPHPSTSQSEEQSVDIGFFPNM